MGGSALAIPLCLFIDERLIPGHSHVGALSVVSPASLQGILFRARVKNIGSRREEIKWSNITPMKLPMAKEIVRNFWWYNGTRIYIKQLAGNTNKDVQRGIFEVIQHLNGISSLKGVFIDWFDHHSGATFDKMLADFFGLPLVMRLDSRATDILQMVDIVLNCEVGSRAAISNREKVALAQYYDAAKVAYRGPQKIYLL